jgi:glycosyltransferase involved in cell wall biosynthesis
VTRRSGDIAGVLGHRSAVQASIGASPNRGETVFAAEAATRQATGKSTRVLIVHNSYQQAGGEDTAVANEHALLDRHGWDTRLWAVSNDMIAGAWTKILTAIRTPYSRPARHHLAEMIADFSPAVVHIHNFFPLLSPSVYDACRSAGVAVVQTLHNFRTICAGGLLLRDGHACEDCIGASPYQAVLHGCYRGSHIGSLAVARMVDIHHRRGTWQHKVDRFIAVSAFAKSKFVAAGFPADRITIKPNFAQDRPIGQSAARAGALYVGRLSAEKGIATLLRAWDGFDAPLRLVGDGPMREVVERAASSSKIIAVGWKAPVEVAEEMARAAFLVLPSVSHENFPMVILEAFSQSLPIIASRIPALEETIEDGANGLLFSAGDAGDLATKVNWALQHPGAMRNMGAKARRIYEEKYSPSVNFGQLTKIYEAAIEDARSAAVG